MCIRDSYNPYLHLAATTGVGIVTLVVSLLCLRHVRLIELLVIPATFLLSNGVEWRAHKGVLHRRVWPLGVLFDRHTPVHHKIYQYDSMAMRSNMESVSYTHLGTRSRAGAFSDGIDRVLTSSNASPPSRHTSGTRRSRTRTGT